MMEGGVLCGVCVWDLSHRRAVLFRMEVCFTNCGPGSYVLCLVYILYLWFGVR